MLSITVLIALLSVIMNADMLRIIMLSCVMLRVIMLFVVAQVSSCS
jgi:hypothetical protein